MLSGPPLPLPLSTPLQQILTYARQPGILGAWVRGSSQAIHLYETGDGAVGRLLVDADLGNLLSRCEQVILCQGTEVVVLDVSTVIQWRAVQVVTATPHLPGLERLSQILPGVHLESAGFHVPVVSQPPEQVLSECLTQGIRVVESRVIYCPPSHASDSPQTGAGSK
jgi:hypothetical protein